MLGHPMKRMIVFAVLASALQTNLATAQTSPMAWSVGYSTYKLRPASGTDQRMNGFGIGGQYSLTTEWALEAALSHQTGTEAGSVNLRQAGVMVGPRYTWTWSARWKGAAHFLVGRQQLQASDGASADQSTSFAYEPGIGLDFQIHRHLALRAQEDLVYTHYAGVDQRSPCLFLGLVLR